MAAAILNTPHAIDVSVYVVRAFVELRDTFIGHKELSRCLDQLESRIAKKFSTQDQAIAGTLDAIRALMTPPEPQRRPIGFITQSDRQKGG